MKKPTKRLYVQLLIACIVSLALLLYIVFFTDNGIIFLQKGNSHSDNEADIVKFLDVGQGDSILISSNGYNALIDFGNKSDYGVSIVKKLREYGVKELHCVVASHYDQDHIGGCAEVLQSIKIHNVVVPELSDQDDESDEDLFYNLQASKATVYTAKPGMIINIGDFELTVIGYYPDEKETNDRSVIVMADIDGIKFFFAGDAGKDVEDRLMDDRVKLDCDVYKVSHHGSKNSSSKKFIEALSPEYAVISAGENNRYGHPHEIVLDILEDANSKIYRTDVSGDITFSVENSKLSVVTQN